MKLRIISGEKGGQKIDAPDGKLTHPMSERIRGSVFNIVGDEIKEASVLDVFAGSGAIGLESLSRGAKSVVFVEKDFSASKTIQNNIDKLGFQNQTYLCRQAVDTWFKDNENKRFDIIFADPPYGDMQLSIVSKLGNLLKSNGLMVLSYMGRSEVPQVNKVVVVDNRDYGNASLAFYRHVDYLI